MKLIYLIWQIIFYILDTSPKFRNKTTMKNADNKMIKLGHASAPHGIKGEVTFVLENAEDSVLENGVKVLLVPHSAKSKLLKEGEFFCIQKISFGNKVICFLEGVDSRNKIEEILPFEIYISRDQFPEADEGEYYISDLIGLDVLDHETREKIGVVAKYYDNNAQIVLSVRSQNTYIELPFIDNFFPEVEVEKGFITMVQPEEV